MNTMASTSPIPRQDEGFARDMLARIAFVRAFEETALKLTQTNPPRVPGSMHFCAGQEAVPLGAAAGLRPDDQMIATYRGHGWALASGLDAYAVMAEICQKADGINGGRGGSAYMMAPETRFIGENSIVGAGTTMACGIAMGNLAAENEQVVIVSIGDGATNQGAVHEALVFAAARDLPVIFVIENNGWAELTPGASMIKIDRLAKRAAGYGIPGATVAGNDPIAVRDSIARAADHCRSGKGPTFLEFRVPRLWGHYNRDIEHYRPKADRQAAEAEDPLKVLAERLVTGGMMDEREITDVIEAESKRAHDMGEAAMEGSDPELSTARDHVIAAPIESDPKTAGTETLSYIEAVNRALRTELETDPRTVVYGEDVGNAGGIFGASRYLQRDFGADRVFDTPIAENAILGSAVGAALNGLKPIVEIMWADFLFVAFDQLINQASNIRYVTRGKASCPMVVRTQQGVTPGSCAQHSQSIEGMLASVPGLKVALAASPQDAYSLLRAAAADPDPVVVIEARGLYQTKGEVTITEGAEPVGKAAPKRPGTDAVILTWGNMVPPALEAAEALKDEGLDIAVLDLRWLAPLDWEAVADAVKAAGGKALILHEATLTAGFGAEIAARLHEGLEGPLDIRRLATPDVRMPASSALQSVLVPNENTIADAALALARGDA